MEITTLVLQIMKSRRRIASQRANWSLYAKQQLKKPPSERNLPSSDPQTPSKTPASPIEISYNYLEDLEQLYRVEVELIVVEEWQKALKVLFTDLPDGNGGISRVKTATPGLPTLRSRSFAPGYQDTTTTKILAKSPAGKAVTPIKRPSTVHNLANTDLLHA
ncbi:hypothetical protein V8E54_010246 [Elaphomyces granulatus]